MEKTKKMDFRNVNAFNVQVNLLSGNYLPMTSDNSMKISIFWRLYHVLALLIEIGHTGGLCAGLIMQPSERALRNGTVAISVTLEVILVMLCLRPRYKQIRRLIYKMDKVLGNADNTMEDIVNSLLKPVITPFAFYSMSSAVSVMLWTIQPVTLIFNRTSFSYLDYNLPGYYTSKPMAVPFFILTNTVMTFGSIIRFLRKVSLDVYMMHFVLLLTARYRYLEIRLTKLFQDSIEAESENEKTGKVPRIKTDQWVESELRKLCRYHKTIVRMSHMVKEVLSTNCSLLFLSSVFRFCFLDIMITIIPSQSFLEGSSIMLYTFSSLTHFFFLCFSVQKLLDASTEITDNTFHENWYKYQTPVQCSFLSLIMANNNLQCNISMIGNYNLSLTSYLAIMNNAYSVALLFLSVN